MRVDYNECKEENHPSYILVALSVAIPSILHCPMSIRMVVMAVIPSIPYHLTLVVMVVMAAISKALAIHPAWDDRPWKDANHVILALCASCVSLGSLWNGWPSTARPSPKRSPKCLFVTLLIYILLNQHIHCAGNINNLIVRATLYGKGPSKVEEQLAATGPIEEFELHPKLGSVGKLYNLVSVVCVLHKRQEQFIDC
jgi:hypothetical protein